MKTLTSKEAELLKDLTKEYSEKESFRKTEALEYFRKVNEVLNERVVTNVRHASPLGEHQDIYIFTLKKDDPLVVILDRRDIKEINEEPEQQKRYSMLIVFTRDILSSHTYQLKSKKERTSLIDLVNAIITHELEKEKGKGKTS